MRSAFDLSFKFDAAPLRKGKSTLIYHLISKYLPAGDVCLATCVQNKAVDAIADKLASAKLPFIVAGNASRLGLVAVEWTLPAIIARDPAVVKLVDEVAELSRRIKRMHPDDAERAALAYRKSVIELRELPAAEQAASDAAVSAARALLCTVATAAATLLSDEALAPAVANVGTAVLDEAGVCNEPKLPLLLRLPNLRRIVAVGDEQQLQPFTRASTGGGGHGRPRLCRHFARGR